MQFVERARLIFATLLAAALGRANVFFIDARVARLWVAELSRNPWGVRRDTSPFSPKRSICTRVERHARRKVETHGSAPEHRRKGIFDEPQKLFIFL